MKLSLFCSCFFILLSSCNLNEKNEASLSKIDDYSSLELFEGIMFIKGKVAKEIPSYAPFVEFMNNNLEKSEYDRITGLINEEIVKLDPNFLDEFKETITSGDPYLIDDMLKEGRKIIGIASKKVPELEDQIDLASFIAADLKMTDFYTDGKFNREEYEQYIAKKVAEFERIENHSNHNRANARVPSLGAAITCWLWLAVAQDIAIVQTVGIVWAVAVVVAVTWGDISLDTGGGGVSAGDIENTLDPEDSGKESLDHARIQPSGLQNDLFIASIAKIFAKPLVTSNG